MRSVEQALQALEDRKNAVFEEVTDEVIAGSRVEVADSDQQRAMFLGWDVDMSELESVSERAAQFFFGNTWYMGSLKVFQGAWVEGLLVGLYLSQQTTKDD